MAKSLWGCYMNFENASVTVHRVDSYDTDLIYDTLKKQFELLRITPDIISGKKVVIKPNLVRKMDPALGGTTHPSLVEAAARIAREWGASGLMIAESPGGVFSESSLRAAYRAGGIDAAAERSGAELNFDTTAVNCKYDGGVTVKSFNILKPINDADVIINLCKLKSHGLTMMSAAVKNYFGSIPGTEKFEMHARFPELPDFSGMIVDLCSMYHESKYTINIVDAIVGMEGNGPTNGSPRKIGAVITSRSAFAADLVCSRIIGFENRVKTVEISKERGLVTENIEILGDSVEDIKISDFKEPDSKTQPRFSGLSVIKNERLLKFFEPRPEINRSKCVACGECVRSCPKHTITLDVKKRRAVIGHKECIRCYCCQELCPHDAVKIKQNSLFKIIR